VAPSFHLTGEFTNPPHLRLPAAGNWNLLAAHPVEQRAAEAGLYAACDTGRLTACVAAAAGDFVDSS